ncbi:MAG: hypothetical protein EXR62_04435 [Chloroflexi bacterium]|nr:hypothetical protein [Chloroflexota bacterium]
MPHTVRIDLSAKVEQWSKNTAVVFSDGITGSFLINSRTKREVREWLKVRYPNRKPAFYLYLLFALLIYLLVRPHLEEIEYIIIDKDYPGEESEKEIKSWLLHFLHRENPALRGSFISFQEVRGSGADRLARSIFEKGEAERRIALSEIQAVWGKKK